MPVDYIVTKIREESPDSSLAKVTNQLSLKAKQTSFNDASVKSCILMPDNVKERINQETKDSYFILVMFQNILKKHLHST